MIMHEHYTSQLLLFCNKRLQLIAVAVVLGGGGKRPLQLHPLDSPLDPISAFPFQITELTH